VTMIYFYSNFYSCIYNQTKKVNTRDDT